MLTWNERSNYFCCKGYIFYGMANFYPLGIVGIPLGREDTFKLIIIANPHSCVWRFFVLFHDQACLTTLLSPFYVTPLLWYPVDLHPSSKEQLFCSIRVTQKMKEKKGRKEGKKEKKNLLFE